MLILTKTPEANEKQQVLIHPTHKSTKHNTHVNGRSDGWMDVLLSETIYRKCCCRNVPKQLTLLLSSTGVTSIIIITPQQQISLIITVFRERVYHPSYMHNNNKKVLIDGVAVDAVAVVWP